jgi:signal peptidase
MFKRVRSFLSTAPVVVLAIVWFLWLRPVNLGGPATFVIVSGISMEPTLYSGDLVILHEQPEYRVGDIVAYRVEGGNVIHRIVETEGERFILQGDNKPGVDPWQPVAGDILGRLWLHIPDAGSSMEKLQEPLWLAVFIAIICFVLLI